MFQSRTSTNRKLPYIPSLKILFKIHIKVDYFSFFVKKKKKKAVSPNLHQWETAQFSPFKDEKYCELNSKL